MKNNIPTLLFCGILLIGLFFRSYKLTSVPAGFFCDEASIGYNAYSVLTTGKDEYGVPFPVFFRSFDDYKGGVAIYSTVPFIVILGLTELAVRLPSVMYGILTIVFLFFLGKEIHSRQVGLLAAFFGALMPWLLHYDRVAFLMNVYATFFTASVYFFIKARTRPYFLLPAFILSGITLYTYQPPKLLIPLLIIGSLAIFYKQYRKYTPYVLGGLIIFSVLCIPFILSIISGEAFARFNMVSIFSGSTSLSKTLTTISSHYVYQLSPQYFFFFGEPTFITRHFTNGFTPLLLTTAPFLLLGFLFIIRTYKHKTSQLLLFWVIIYPIGGALVQDPPFSSRSIIGAPLAALLIALGCQYFFSFVKKLKRPLLAKSCMLLLSLSVFLNAVQFFIFYFYSYPFLSVDFWGWQYGAKQIVMTFITNENKYDDLIMEPAFNAPSIFFKFYAPHDCSTCKAGYLKETIDPKRKQLFAVTPSYLTENHIHNFVTQKIIFYPNGTVAFLIGEIVQ